MPVLEIFTLVLMLGVGALQIREGIFIAAALMVNVLIAGLLAFNFWEPLAAALSQATGGTLDGYADILCLLLLFSVFLGFLRVLTFLLMADDVVFHPLAHQIGGAFFGLVTGYLLAGILVCMFQTLPWHEQFLWYDPQGTALGAPDRVWLTAMDHASRDIFDYAEERRFYGLERPPEGENFIERHARHRRYRD